MYASALTFLYSQLWVASYSCVTNEMPSLARFVILALYQTCTLNGRLFIV